MGMQLRPYSSLLSVGIIVLIIGSSISLASLYPLNIAPPNEPFEVGAGPSNHCRIDHTEIYVYLPANSVSVWVFLNSCTERQFHAYALVPFLLTDISFHAYTYSDKQLIADFSFKNVPECGACIVNATFSSEEIYPNLKAEFHFRSLSNLIQSSFLGSSKAAVLTFFGPQSDLLYNETYKYQGNNSLLAISSPLFVHFNLPADTRFSYESFPQPIQYYMRNDQIWVMFNPTFPSNRYAQTISCQFVSPSMQGLGQFMFLVGGILIGFATSLIVESGLHREGTSASERGDSRKSQVKTNEFWTKLLGILKARNPQRELERKPSMFPFKAETERLKIEKKIEENNTRESSTLVLSTVASTVSLAIFATLADKPIESRIEWATIAFLFSFLGFIYRELTIHTSEMANYRELNKELCLDPDRSFASYIRMVIVRLFLLLPMAIFFPFVGLFTTFLSVVGALILSLILSIIETVRRTDC
jgi:hypothetical protein